MSHDTSRLCPNHQATLHHGRVRRGDLSETPVKSGRKERSEEETSLLHQRY